MPSRGNLDEASNGILTPCKAQRTAALGIGFARRRKGLIPSRPVIA